MSDDESKDPQWIRNYVLMMINEVKDVPKETRDGIQFMQRFVNSHQTFCNKYPTLLKLVCAEGENFDMAKLDEFLGMLSEINSGDRDLDETNKELGQEAFDKYVKPHLDMTKEKGV